MKVYICIHTHTQYIYMYCFIFISFFRAGVYGPKRINEYVKRSPKFLMTAKKIALRSSSSIWIGKLAANPNIKQ